MHRKLDKNLEKRKIKPARSTGGLNNRLHLFDIELNKLKGLTYIINTGLKKSMSVNVIETATINIIIEAICIPECWHFKATFSCHSLHFQKVNAVYRCLTYRRTVVAFCLAEGENDTGIVDRCTHRVKGKEMVLTLRFSTFMCGYRTQQGFKAVTFFDKPLLLTSLIHERVCILKLHNNKNIYTESLMSEYTDAVCNLYVPSCNKRNSKNS